MKKKILLLSVLFVNNLFAQTINEKHKTVYCSNVTYTIPQQTEDEAMVVLNCNTSFTGKFADGSVHKYNFIIVERQWKGTDNVQILNATLLVDGQYVYNDIYGQPTAEIQDGKLYVLGEEHGFRFIMKGNEFIPEVFSLVNDEEAIVYDFVISYKDKNKPIKK